MQQAPFNPKVQSLEQPPIPLVRSWAETYKGQLGPLLDLSQAVPDFRPHPELMRLLGECAADPQYFGYGAIEGERELREVYARSVSDRYGATIGYQQVHITSGCNQAFMATMLALAAPGNNVLMCNPCYFNHHTSLSMLGVEVRHIGCQPEHGFLPQPEAIDALMDDGTRALVLTTPNNPTGALYPSGLLQQLLELCQSKGIWLVVDETYRDFLPQSGGAPHSLFSFEHWQRNFIQLYSFSKSFCIPGHRLGAVTAAEETVAEIAKVMDNLQICAPRAAQVAVAQSMEMLSAWREGNRQEIQSRASALTTVMKQLPRWRLQTLGAYFAFIRHPFDANSMQVAQQMAEEVGVSCLPGDFFGEANGQYLRFAFANVSGELLAELPDRLLDLRL